MMKKPNLMSMRFGFFPLSKSIIEEEQVKMI